MDENRGIGFEGRLPWHLSSDLQRFKSLTWGHHIIMGRKTYQSIGRTLPGRTNLVISRNKDFQAPVGSVVPTLTQAVEIALRAGDQEAFIIGGGEIYSLALRIADCLYITEVHARVLADTHFPPFSEEAWEELERRDFPVDKGDDFSYTYRILQRSGP